MQCLCVSKENNQYIYNEKYRPTKHCTSCDVTIADAHIAISMLKRYIVQPYFECCADGTERGKWSIPGPVLKKLEMFDSKTKPASKLNCRVIIFIYKLGCQECKKRHLLDLFLNSFELWMNMTKLHRQHFVFFTAHYQNTLMLILHHSYYKNMQLISYQSKTGLVMGRAVRSAVWLM